MKKALCILLLVLWCGVPAAAQPTDTTTLYIRVIDTGPGLCTVTRMPGPDGDFFYMVYDAGHWTYDEECSDGVADVIPTGEQIDLMVLSHSDSDHLGAVPEILDAYIVDRVIRSGYPRPLPWPGTLKQARSAIKKSRIEKALKDVNLKYTTNHITPGDTLVYGSTQIVKVAGFQKPPATWDINNKSEKRNAASIIIRLDYAGKSVLFTGDAVGRHLGDPVTANIAMERFVVDNAATVSIDSDVLIAPHHGADNGSSKKFIEAVTPEWVIFPAGHDHEHPRDDAAQRYLDAAVDINKMFRTDFGDNEGGDEWSHGATTQGDSPGDDDVEIMIAADGVVTVRYRP